MSAAIVLDIEQGSQEWLELRRKKVTATDASVLMSGIFGKTPYSLWLEKMGLLETKKNFVMQKGLDLESLARASYCMEKGISVTPKVLLHPNIDYMMCSLDGVDNKFRNAVEIKCPGSEDHNKALSGTIPEKYLAQLQHQLVVLDLDVIDYYSFSPNAEKSSMLLQAHRDERFIKEMLQIESEFFECIQNLKAPELKEKDLRLMQDDLWTHTATEWKSIQKTLKDLEKREKEMRETLISMSQGQNCSGAGIKVNRIMRKGSIDYSSIIKLQGLDLEQYRSSPVETWRITG